MKITFPEKEGLNALNVKVGFDHSLVLFEEIATKAKKLYSIGQNEVNFNCLGITQIEASDVSIFYREITAFRGFDIVDFAAGHRTSHVIVGGDKDIQTGIHEHKINDKVHKGILHFYFDTNKDIQYVLPEDYEGKKDTLPELCYAIKAPINDHEKLKALSELKSLALKVIDYESTTSGHADVQCDVTHQPIKEDVRYVSHSRINNDEVLANFSERAFMQPTQYDINPLIFYRLSKPLKADATPPVIDTA